MPQITVDKTYCWCCMKLVSERRYQSMMGGEYKVYKLGDCCKDLSTEVIHKEES